MELLHAEAGLFLTRRLSVEAMGAAVGVFGPKLGLGATYALGGAAPGSAPRHAFLLHARFMLDPGGDQVGHGDHLGAYAVPAIGYGFLADSGFTARILAGPVITRERRGGPDGEAKLSGGIPFVAASFGYAF
jgi:hypothetical protein